MKKILIITQKVDVRDPILGFFHRWIQEFAAQCDEVTVICLKRGEHHLPTNVRVLSLGKESGVSRLKYLFRFYAYVWKYRQEYEGVFVHMNQVYVLLGVPLWRMLGKKVALWYAHGHVPYSLRIAEKMVNIIFTSTKSGFRIQSPKLRVVGQGIDTDFFVPPKVQEVVYGEDGHARSGGDEFCISMVGRISPVKNFETLIDAVFILRQKGLNVRADIVGGADTDSQREYLADLKKRARNTAIRFIGPVSQGSLPELLAQSQLFVNTSLTGSLDKTGLEAMAMGLPILTCNEAYAEILGVDTERSMTIKKDVADLAKKIESVYNLSAREYRALSDRMRHIVVSEHSIGKLVRSIISLYH